MTDLFSNKHRLQLSILSKSSKQLSYTNEKFTIFYIFGVAVVYEVEQSSTNQGVGGSVLSSSCHIL